MMLYRNTKVKDRSPGGDTDYFDIEAGVLLGDTLALYMFIICLGYVLRISIDKMKDKGFKLTKERSRRYPAQTITDADYADDIELLANTLAQTETQLYSLERAAANIGLHVNAHKTEYMCLNQTGDISTLNGRSLKLVDTFTHLGNRCSFFVSSLFLIFWGPCVFSLSFNRLNKPLRNRFLIVLSRFFDRLRGTMITQS